MQVKSYLTADDLRSINDRVSTLENKASNDAFGAIGHTMAKLITSNITLFPNNLSADQSKSLKVCASTLELNPSGINTFKRFAGIEMPLIITYPVICVTLDPQTSEPLFAQASLEASGTTYSIVIHTTNPQAKKGTNSIKATKVTANVLIVGY